MLQVKCNREDKMRQDMPETTQDKRIQDEKENYIHNIVRFYNINIKKHFQTLNRNSSFFTKLSQEKRTKRPEYPYQGYMVQLPQENTYC